MPTTWIRRAEPFKVQPILTFPGWWITRKAKGSVNVLNPDEIKSALITTKLPVLSDKQVRQISFLLDQRCRTVGF